MPEGKDSYVNDFSILVATVNGSGSQTANNVLIKSIFQMGVPVSGKNIFPSNIAGLPTWFSIRASGKSHLARKKTSDILIALNQETFADDVRGLKSGAVVIHESSFKTVDKREDLIYYPVPFGEISALCCPDLKLRKYVTNMIYVGVAGALLGIDQSEMESALGKVFRKKQKALEVNSAALKAGFEHAGTRIEKKDPFRIEKMNGTTGKILIDGNYAAAVGAIFAGCAVCAWYPITPASTLGEAMAELARKYRRDKTTGKLNCAIVQSE
ncbi:MAG: 2-oxoacid:acceptor oxidoreductase family protein, partial [Deltaproteobacteria bacterium]|nr:2-oxoacid:acceptor oxidoreductase family protein [Deltaproteobacteria bacterium]